MRPPDSRAISKLILVCVVSIIVIAVSAGAYVNYSSLTPTEENARTFTVTTVENQTVTTTTTTTVYPSSSAITSVASFSATYPPPVIPKNSSTAAVTVNQNSSLELVMMINATTITSGQGIDIEYYFANPTNQNITLNSVWKFAAPGTNDTYCGNLVGPAVYAGVYTGQNVSEAIPLVLLNPDYGVSCPVGMHASTYSFFADSGTSPSFFPISGYLVPASNCPYYNGTTILDIEPHCWVTQSFPKGVYTIAVGDEWEDVVLLYLRVT